MCQVWYFMFGIHLINMFIMLLSYFNSPLFWLMLKWTFIIFLLFIREVQIITINVVKEELKLLIDKFADQHHICIKIAKFSISSGWKNWNSSHSTHSKNDIYHNSHSTTCRIKNYKKYKIFSLQVFEIKAEFYIMRVITWTLFYKKMYFHKNCHNLHTYCIRYFRILF